MDIDHLSALASVKYTHGALSSGALQALLMCEEDVEGEDDPKAIINLISDICADFVTAAHYGYLLKGILLDEPGAWIDLMQMIDDEDVRKKSLQGLYSVDATDISVTWLNDPDRQEGFCLIQCYVPKLLWTWTAYHNRDYHLSRY